MEKLLEIMALLRSPDGCPWDREQDHRSLKPYVIEEAYELLEAIDIALDQGDDRPLIEELGDLLLQVVFHTQIAGEAERFHFEDVVRGLREKLIRRHPHVFEKQVETNTEAVVADWEAIKKKEKGTTSESASLLDGIPRGMPALSLAKEVQRRAARVGFEWETVDGALDKVSEEIAEIAEVQRQPDDADYARRLEHEWGDLFFALVNVARYCNVDPESALHGATQRFQRRFRYIEDAAKRQGLDMETMTLDDMDALWNEAKRTEEGRT